MKLFRCLFFFFCFLQFSIAGFSYAQGTDALDSFLLANEPVFKLKKLSAIRAQQSNEYDSAIFLQVLKAEMSLYADGIGDPLAPYLQLMHKVPHPAIAQRIFDWTEGRFDRKDVAMSAAEILSKDKESWLAQESYIKSLLWEGQIEKALLVVNAYLSQEQIDAAPVFLALAKLLVPVASNESVIPFVMKWRDHYASVPEAYFACAMLMAAQDRITEAVIQIDKALSLKKDWPVALLIKLQIQLAAKEVSSAVASFQQAIASRADALEMRILLVKSLVSVRYFSESKALLVSLTEEFPERADLFFMLGLVLLQLGDISGAESALLTAYHLDFSSHDLLVLSLGQVAETKQDYPVAMLWYDNLYDSNNYLYAVSNLVSSMVAKDNAEDALALMSDMGNARQDIEPAIMWLRIRLLRVLNRADEEMELLHQAIQKYPDDPDLLFDYAMRQESIGDYAAMEKNLRRLIAQKPNHAVAYNALGYYFADKNIRLKEAKELLHKALSLDPENPMILDSTGWLAFRLGDLDQALEYLEYAYRLGPDAEIGAHLVEVLWSLNRHDDAKALLNELELNYKGNQAIEKLKQTLVGL